MQHAGPFLLKLMAKGLLNSIPFGGMLGSSVDVLVDLGEVICKETWDTWRQSRKESELRLAIEEIAQATPSELHNVIEEISVEVTSNQPENRESIKTLLHQVQPNIRKTLRRREDPKGLTISNLRKFDSAQTLLPIIPTRTLTWKPGDRPLPGNDLVLQELLGVGGFGEVWLATNPEMRSKKPVALKFCIDKTARTSLRRDRDILDRVAERGRHPGIVQLQNTYLSAEVPALEFEYVDGGDLGDLIEDWHAAGRTIDFAEVRESIHELATTLEFAHKNGIIHRDLKPANILVPSLGSFGNGKQTHRFKIADFGIGKIQADVEIKAGARGVSVSRQLTETLSGSHTALYSSDEQKKGMEAHPADDIYSLGVIWYQMLVGDLSLGAPTGRRWPDRLRAMGLSDCEIDLIGDCFEPREDRLQNATAFLEKFRKCVGVSTTDADPGEVEIEEEITQVRKPEKRIVLPPETKFLTSKTTGIQLLKIPAGTFNMGSTSAQIQAYKNADARLSLDWVKNEQPQHLVSITKPFSMSAYQITQGDYFKVMGTNPSHFATVAGEDTTRFPVEKVSWFDAIAFCNQLSELDGLTAYYNLTNIQREGAAIKAASVSIAGGSGYRLPTEAEWEYACRAGTSSAFHFGDVLNGDKANVDGNYPFGTTEKGMYLQRTTTVGSYRDAENKFGLFDVHGNVWEWCFDVYDEKAYSSRRGTTQDPIVTNGSEYRVLRGGSWYFGAWNARSAVRYWSAPDGRSGYIGFRVVR